MMQGLLRSPQILVTLVTVIMVASSSLVAAAASSWEIGGLKVIWVKYKLYDYIIEYCGPNMIMLKPPHSYPDFEYYYGPALESVLDRFTRRAYDLDKLDEENPALFIEYIRMLRSYVSG